MYYSLFKFDDYGAFYNICKEIFISRTMNVYSCLSFILKTAGHLYQMTCNEIRFSGQKLTIPVRARLPNVMGNYVSHQSLGVTKLKEIALGKFLQKLNSKTCTEKLGQGIPCHNSLHNHIPRNCIQEFPADIQFISKYFAVLCQMSRLSPSKQRLLNFGDANIIHGLNWENLIGAIPLCYVNTVL